MQELGEGPPVLFLHGASVAGTSWVDLASPLGGYRRILAFRGAAAHPDRVQRIVELSWPMGAPMTRVPWSMRMSALPGMQSAMARMPVTRGAVRMLRQIGLDRALRAGRFDEPMIDWFLALLQETDTLANDMRSSPLVVTFAGGLNERMLLDDASLASITVPVLLLWGDEDPNGGADVAEMFARRLPNADLEILTEAGHAPWIDEPERCVGRVAAFLAG